MIELPAISTVHDTLDRNGLVKSPKSRRYKAQGTELFDAKRPNQLWCSDYKGEFIRIISDKLLEVKRGFSNVISQPSLR